MAETYSRNGTLTGVKGKKGFFGLRPQNDGLKKGSFAALRMTEGAAQDDGGRLRMTGLANVATGLAISTRCGSEKFFFNEKPEKSSLKIPTNTGGYVFDGSL